MSVFNGLGTNSPRWWRRIAATVGMSLAFVLAAGAPAHAANATLSDDFEAADANYVWTTEHGECCLVPGNNPDAHSGSHAGFLPFARLGSWTSLGRSVHLPAVLEPRTRCKAWIWIDPLWPITVNVEVINPTDWTYIALSTVTLAANSGWQQISTRVWMPYTSDVYFRVSNISDDVQAYGGEAWIDDFSVLCAWT